MLAYNTKPIEDKYTYDDILESIDKGLGIWFVTGMEPRKFDSVSYTRYITAGKGLKLNDEEFLRLGIMRRKPDPTDFREWRKEQVAQGYTFVYSDIEHENFKLVAPLTFQDNLFWIMSGVPKDDIQALRAHLMLAFKMDPLPKAIVDEVHSIYKTNLNDCDMSDAKFELDGVSIGKDIEGIVIGDYGAFVKFAPESLNVSIAEIPAFAKKYFNPGGNFQGTFLRENFEDGFYYIPVTDFD